MRIGGFQKVSLIDYPGKVAAVIFTQGCNFRCPFCHNKELVLPSSFKTPIAEDEVLGFLAERQGKIEGVVITGGEPTLQEDLVPFLRRVKELGYPVKLDTNGSRPDILKEIIGQGLVDLIAMDVKGPLERYREFTGTDVELEDIRQSIAVLLSSGIPHLFRTTAVKPLSSSDDFLHIAALVEGAQQYILQEFVPRETVLDQDLLDKPQYTEDELGELQKAWAR